MKGCRVLSTVTVLGPVGISESECPFVLSSSRLASRLRRRTYGATLSLDELLDIDGATHLISCVQMDSIEPGAGYLDGDVVRVGRGVISRQLAYVGDRRRSTVRLSSSD